MKGPKRDNCKNKVASYTKKVSKQRNPNPLLFERINTEMFSPTA